MTTSQPPSDMPPEVAEWLAARVAESQKQRRIVYTLAEAAEALSLSKWQVAKMVRAGQLPKFSPLIAGRRVLIPVQQLEDLIEGRISMLAAKPASEDEGAGG